MKELNGAELAAFIKQRQLKQVRSMRQGHDIVPKLAIIKTIDDPVIDTYIRLKQAYGADIDVEVKLHTVQQPKLSELIAQLNEDTSVHGIILQLPLANPDETDAHLASVAREKDVDGLVAGTPFVAATAQAISWLLDGYNIELRGKSVTIVGKGRLVGAPLERLMQSQGYEPKMLDDSVQDLSGELSESDVIVTATGQAGLVESSMLKSGAVVIDAGVATDSGKTVGDLDPNVYERQDLVITPKRGGVGPLTVSALFENLLLAASGEVV